MVINLPVSSAISVSGSYVLRTTASATNGSYYGDDGTTKLNNSFLEEIVSRLKELENQYPKNVIVKCEWCGRWGTIGMDCVGCGLTIGRGEMYGRKNDR